MEQPHNRSVSPPEADSPVADMLPRMAGESDSAVSLLPKLPGKSVGLRAVLVAVAIVAVGAIGAYAFWYNSPDKVVVDALRGLVGVKSGSIQGEFTAQKGSESVNRFSFTAIIQDKNVAQVDISTKDSKSGAIAGSLVLNDKTSYLRLSGMKYLLGSAAVTDAAAIVNAFTPMLTKVDGKWVSITDDDLKQLGAFIPAVADQKDSQIACSETVINTFQTTASQQSQVVDVFLKNQFLTIDKTLGSDTINGHPSNHYLLKFDNTKATSFGKAVETTDFFKALDRCYGGKLKSTNAQATSKSETSVPSIELWVDQWSHQLTKVRLAEHESNFIGSLEATTTLNKPQKVAIPTADTTLSTLVADIQKDFVQTFLPTFDQSLLDTCALQSRSVTTGVSAACTQLLMQ